jgi:hypothetical protein
MLSARLVASVNRMVALSLTPMKFHEKLAGLVSHRGFNPASFAKSLGGTSESTARRWILGLAEPRRAQLVAVAKFFAVPVEFLADDSIEHPSQVELTIEETALLRMARTAGASALFRPEGSLDDGFDHERWMSRKSHELSQLMVEIFKERVGEGRIYRPAHPPRSDASESDNS